MIGTVANRYARALADVVGPAGNYRAMQSELESFAALYRESAELREAFESPIIAPAKKRAILDTLLGRLGLSPTGSNFLRVLLAHYRMPLIEEVAAGFRKVANRRLGIVEVKISSARELSPAEQEALREHFRKLTAHQVEIEFERNGQLLAGLLAQIESTVYDGTALGYLNRLGRQLAAS